MNAANLKNLNYRLYVVICFTLMIPTLYNTFRIHLIGDVPNEWGFNIASQIAWLNIIYEILQEGVTLPLFFVLGAVVSYPNLFRQKILQGLAFVLTVYSLIALIIWIFAGSIVHFLNQSPDLIPDTIQYIRLETIAIPLRVVSDCTLIALILLDAKPKIYLFLLIQLVVRVISDYVFIGEAMLGWGVIGVAYSTIVINGILSAAGLLILFQILLKAEKVQTNAKQALNVSWKKWLGISSISGLESAVRNIAFIVMILKLVNEIGGQGTLWITNGFIWGWLLLPILALGTLIKQDVSNHHGIIGDRFKGYFSLTLLIIGVFWLITIPIWGWFIHNVMGIEDYSAVVSLALLFLPFYVIFALNNIFDSYFYGMGRTDLMLYQSLIVNGGYYLIMFILYKQGIFAPTLQSIALLFGFGIVLDFIATVILFHLVHYPLKRLSKHT